MSDDSPSATKSADAPELSSSALTPGARFEESGSSPRGRGEFASIGVVEAVHASPGHTMSKPVRESIRLLEGLGVEGDAHMGETVKHRSRVQRDPTQPNLRQVHLIHAELHDELRAQGFDVTAGAMGENITTRGIALLELATGALLHVGDEAVVEVTGLRNPCGQLNGVAEGLMAACVGRDGEGNLVRKAGVMGVVVAGGHVRPGDAIRVELPAGPQQPLQPV
jgi:MOSC domain-containing protein YiiM